MIVISSSEKTKQKVNRRKEAKLNLFHKINDQLSDAHLKWNLVETTGIVCDQDIKSDEVYRIL